MDIFPLGVVVDSCFSSSLPKPVTPLTPTAQRATPLIIRTVDPSDLKSLAEVLMVSFHSLNGLLYWISPVLKLGIYEDLRSRLRNGAPHYRCLVVSHPVAQSREAIAGTVEISLRPKFFFGDDVPYISNLAVSPSYRRQGIARKLLNQCEHIAREWGFQELSLHVLEDNYQAQQLYFNSGYQLHRIESSLINWLFQRPRRLFLNKKILEVQD